MNRQDAELVMITRTSFKSSLPSRDADKEKRNIGVRGEFGREFDVVRPKTWAKKESSKFKIVMGGKANNEKGQNDREYTDKPM